MTEHAAWQPWHADDHQHMSIYTHICVSIHVLLYIYIYTFILHILHIYIDISKEREEHSTRLYENGIWFVTHHVFTTYINLTQATK